MFCTRATSAPVYTRIGLAEQLLSDVKRLEQEMAFSKTKLQAAQDIITKMPSEGGSCLFTQHPTLTFPHN